MSRPSWSLLVVVELRWHEPADPFPLPDREARLRLVRAYPLGNEEAWRLVLHELGTRPDFTIADCSPAITNAVNTEYAGTVGLIPSFFHIHRNIRQKLVKVPQATTKLEGRTVLIGSLAEHLETLTRDEVTRLTTTEWSTWWDDLLVLLRGLNAPTAGFLEQRKIYQDRVAVALPLLRSHPHLPASNAAVESQLRLRMEPFLENRKALYRNLARTNFLFDLSVCRSQDLFLHDDTVAKLIREANTAAGGWSPRPRIIGDVQPAVVLPTAVKKPPPYSLLLNPLLIRRLLDQRTAAVAP
jgi:hypothetical protein